MAVIEVEICVNAVSPVRVGGEVAACHDGGAATLELCSAMDRNGLTPRMDHVAAARAAFRRRKGVLIMIRPRAGDFRYASAEVAAMVRQIHRAAAAGADGVVFGALRAKDGLPDVEALRRLMKAAADEGLKTTFHRAFDAAADRAEALEMLADLGLQRVMTSGLPWGAKGTALDGAKEIAKTIRRAKGRLEVVIGGGVGESNVAAILARVPLTEGKVSVHAYSGAQRGGVTSREAVRALVRAANGKRKTKAAQAAEEQS